MNTLQSPTRQRVEPKITTRQVCDSEGFPRYDAYAEVDGQEILVTWDCLSDMLDAEIAEWLRNFHASLSS